MKRISALFVVLVITASLVGCSGTVISRGHINGNVYTNESIGISFTKPDGWIYLSEDEISDLMNASAELMDQTEEEAEVTESVTTIDMFAQNWTTGTNVSISYENLEMSSSLDVTVDDVIESTKNELKSAYEAFAYSFDNTEIVTIGGVEFTRLGCEARYMDQLAMSQYAYFRKVDKYMIVISITLVNGTDVSVIESYFSEIK